MLLPTLGYRTLEYGPGVLLPLCGGTNFGTPTLSRRRGGETVVFLGSVTADRGPGRVRGALTRVTTVTGLENFFVYSLLSLRFVASKKLFV